MPTTSGLITRNEHSDETLINAMRTLALERAEKYKTLLVPRFFPLSTLEETTYLGSFTWSCPSMGLRWMIEKNAIFPFGIPQSPSEFARDYLSIKYPKRLRARSKQITELRKHRSAPLWARRGEYYNCAYVDIHAAYWSILQSVGWDADYHPDMFLGKKSHCQDYPLPDHKLARNCLVTAGLTSPLVIWDGSKLVERRIGNPRPNIGVWALCQDILHGIAVDALNCGAVYIHTDGYILPRPRAQELIDRIGQWGLEGRIKYTGDTIIYGPGTYDIGEKKTKRRFVRMSLDTSQVRDGDYSFLKENFSIFAKRTTLI